MFANMLCTGNTERRQNKGMGAGAKKGWAGGGGNIKEVGGARIILCMLFPNFARMKVHKSLTLSRKWTRLKV